MSSNFALSKEGQMAAHGGGTGSFDQVVIEGKKPFDGRKNLMEVVYAAVSGEEPSEGLLYAAAMALQRQRTNTQGDDEWADRLSGEFFDGLNGRS